MSSSQLELVTLTLMEGFSPAALNPTIKQAAKDTGDPHWEKATSHGFRRGMACDLALDKKDLGAILYGGDWKSAAFRAYIQSVSDQLHAQALLRVLGDASDSV